MYQYIHNSLSVNQNFITKLKKELNIYVYKLIHYISNTCDVF